MCVGVYVREIERKRNLDKETEREKTEKERERGRERNVFLQEICQTDTA